MDPRGSARGSPAQVVCPESAGQVRARTRGCSTMGRWLRPVKVAAKDGSCRRAEILARTRGGRVGSRVPRSLLGLARHHRRKPGPRRGCCDIRGSDTASWRRTRRTWSSRQSGLTAWISPSAARSPLAGDPSALVGSDVASATRCTLDDFGNIPVPVGADVGQLRLTKHAFGARTAHR